MVESQPSKLLVASSILVSRSIIPGQRRTTFTQRLTLDAAVARQSVPQISLMAE